MMYRLRQAFRMIPADKAAKNEYEEALRDLLVAQTGLDYAKAIVAYNQARVRRLGAYIQEPLPTKAKVLELPQQPKKYPPMSPVYGL